MVDTGGLVRRLGEVHAAAHAGGGVEVKDLLARK